MRCTLSILLLAFAVMAPRSNAFLAPALRHPYQSAAYSTISLSLAARDDTSPIIIAMTREQGKNEKLRKQLVQQLVTDNPGNPAVDIQEVPCIAHADGPDYDQLGDRLLGDHWDYVTVTSPEAARVLASAWHWNKDDAETATTKRAPAVAAVGKATETALERAGIPVAFCPSKATAKVLVKELPALPRDDQMTTTVLYPASAQAATTLQDGLAARGNFDVTRLNTYDTVTATWTDEQMAIAQQTTIICVASPSSIKGWLSNVGATAQPSRQLLAACIGETSAQACRELGFDESQIFYPEKPGIPGWVDAVQEALDSIRVLQEKTT